MTNKRKTPKLSPARWVRARSRALLERYNQTGAGICWGVALMTTGLILGVFALAAGSSPTPTQGKPDTPGIVTVLDRIHAGDVATATLDEDTSTLTLGYTAAAATTLRVPIQAQVILPHAYQHDVIAALIAARVDLATNPAADTTTTITANSPYSSAATATAATKAHQVAPAQPSTGSGSNLAPLSLLCLILGALTLAGGLVNRATRNAAARAASRPAEPSTSKSKDPAVTPATVPATRFTDVAGCDEAIAELTEMVAFLRDPARFTRTGAKPPKGALLAGPPGTGKTLLARAVAGEAGVPFYSASGSDFVEMFVGVGAKRVRDLFAAAKQHDTAIIFIDEIDAVARRRSAADVSTGGSGETENTLVALLAEMDGFDKSNVIVLAATNRADVLDPAITRPGRLDRKIEVPNPDRRGRERILQVHTKGKPVSVTVDLTGVARRTPGFSGAQLEALVNEACMEAVRRDQDIITQECFDFAVATIAMGRARTSALVTEHDREITAWHEAGHTLAAYLQADADDPVQVTIVPRGPAGGVTWMSGNDDMFLPRLKAHAQLVTAMAGRAAEEALLAGEYTQGAHGDMQSATELATRMATQYGMTRLGYQVRAGSSAASKEVSDVVDELLVNAHAVATDLLAAHRALLERVATELLEEETLTLAQVDALARECGVARHARVDVPPPPRQLRPVPSDTETADGVVPAVAAQASPGRRRRTLAAASAAIAAWRRPDPEEPQMVPAR